MLNQPKIVLRCTWEGCAGSGLHPQLDANGKPWARLCETHHNRLAEILSGSDARKILSVWVRAQGGPRAAAARCHA